MKKFRKREKCCRRCFAYVPAGSRKCGFCGYKFKSSGRYLFDKIKHVLKIDKAYTLEKSKTPDGEQKFFTISEIENILQPKNFRVLMYLVLDDIAFLDETALIELGSTLMMMGER